MHESPPAEEESDTLLTVVPHLKLVVFLGPSGVENIIILAHKSRALQKIIIMTGAQMYYVFSIRQVYIECN